MSIDLINFATTASNCEVDSRHGTEPQQRKGLAKGQRSRQATAVSVALRSLRLLLDDVELNAVALTAVAGGQPAKRWC